MSDPRTIALIDDLRNRPAETPWIEIKVNNADPGMIGRSISALSNSARFSDQHFAYIVWGIRDNDHAIAGTTFDPSREKAQKQPLEFWLAQRVKPSLSFAFKTVEHPNGNVLLLEIPAATLAPIEFDGTAYVRIGSATPRPSEHPSRLQTLWDKLRPYIWESGIGEQFVPQEEVPAKLDYPASLL